MSFNLSCFGLDMRLNKDYILREVPFFESKEPYYASYTEQETCRLDSSETSADPKEFVLFEEGLELYRTSLCL